MKPATKPRKAAPLIPFTARRAALRGTVRADPFSTVMLLPDAKREAALREALDTAKTTLPAEARGDVFLNAAPFLPEGERETAVRNELASARANPDAGQCGAALLRVAPLLAEGEREAVLEEVLALTTIPADKAYLRAVLETYKTENNSTVENSGINADNPPVKQSPDIGGATLKQAESQLVDAIGKLGFDAAAKVFARIAPPDERARLESMAARGRELTGRDAATQLSEADSAAFMTPQRVAMLTADTPLSRLQIRYEKRLQEIVLPEDKIKDVKEARAANSLAATYRNLVKQQIKAGLKPQPQDERVTKAQRLSVAFYREQKAAQAPRRRGRPPKFAMNALA